MRNLSLFLVASLFCLSAFCGECWSDGFNFDGREITEEAICLRPNDPLAYSSALAKGSPKSLVINVEDTSDLEKTASIFEDSSETVVEGTVCWDYEDERYKDFSIDDTYILTEKITSDTETKTFNRMVTILPEPAVILTVLSVAAFFLRRKMKIIISVFAITSFGVLTVKADVAVSNVNCLQMWPFDRSVVINYNLTSENAESVFAVKFYGSEDGGKTTFVLSERGNINGEGSNGVVTGQGVHKAIWMPDESFYQTVKKDFKIKVEANLQPTYMVIDLSGGTKATSYAVSYMESEPEGGWTDEYKTGKMVFRLIPPGNFMMGSPEDELGRYSNETLHEVTLTKTFYIGVFQCTQKQYELITGFKNDVFTGDTRAADFVRYSKIRGNNKGSLWPYNNEVDEDSFLGILRGKVNMDLDLPTEAQWEYACRAGTATALNDGNNLTNIFSDGNLNKLGRYKFDRNDGKGGYNGFHTSVGNYLPNTWGLYDMHGNVWEWCLDCYSDDLGSAPVKDPTGPFGGEQHVVRGGAYYQNADCCRSAWRSHFSSTSDGESKGFRLVLVL